MSLVTGVFSCFLRTAPQAPYSVESSYSSRPSSDVILSMKPALINPA